MVTGYKIRHIPTGELLRTPYRSMTEAHFVLELACLHSSTEYDVQAVEVDERPDALPRCGECDELLLPLGEFLTCWNTRCSLYDRGLTVAELAIAEPTDDAD